MGLGGLQDFGGSLGLPGGTSGSKIFGTKPTVPTLAQAGQQSLTDIQAILPGAESLASQVNQFSQAQKNAMMSFVTPDWQKNLGLAGADISKMLQGELPTSDIAQSQLKSVSSAIGGGYGDSPAMRNLVARDLGITQQQEIEKGLAANDRWLKTAENLTAPQFDFTKMFPTTQEEFSRDWQQSLISAAPDPTARGRSDEWNALIGEVLSVYAGGGGFKGGYTPNYGGTNNYNAGPYGTAPDGSTFWYTPSGGNDVNINIDPSMAAGTDIPAMGG